MTESPQCAPHATLSWRKKTVFGLLVATVFLLAIECLLAACQFQPALANRDPYVGFESTIPLLVERRGEQGVFLETAPNKLKYFNPQRFAKQKPANTIRVFCLGGSTTFGRPYDDTTSFVGWLRELLPRVDPNRNWDVINAGGISYASYRVASVLDELRAYSPDLFIVYTGHNEFLEERTYRGLRGRPSSLRRLETMLLATRTYSLAHSLVSERPPGGQAASILPAEVDAMLDHSVGPDSYHRDDRLRVDVINHFEFNLRRMVEAARSAGAEILFIKPAANMKDFSPFKSEHRSDLGDRDRQRWDELIAQADRFLERGRAAQALDALAQAAAIDNRPAELYFRIGRALLAERQVPEARVAFQRAIDEDVCPLRALSDLQRIVERVAVANQAPLVDFDSILRNECLRSFGHQSPGREFFVDHVHPTIASHRLLAAAIVEAIIQRGLATPVDTWGDEAVLAATERIESRIDPELQSRALTNLAQVLGWAGKQAEAGPLAVEAVRLRAEHGLPLDAESMYYAAVHHAVTGDDRRAIEVFRQVLEREPENAEAHWRLAALLFDQQNYSEAEAHFREAVRINPDDGYSHQMLGVILLDRSRFQQALLSFRQAAALSPNDASINANIAIALEKIEQAEAAAADDDVGEAE